MRPTAQGFDEYLGFLQGAALFGPLDDPDYVESRQEFDPIDAFLWANLDFAVAKDGGQRFAPDAYMTDYLADQAVRAIDANKNRPFFLYLAFNAPHTPLQATRADYDAVAHIENHTLRVYAAMIRALDRGVGKVLDALAANGLDENTLVLFTSDNGGANYIGLPDINAPYRGWKMNFFEGGVHTPFFAALAAGAAGGPQGGRADRARGHLHHRRDRGRRRTADRPRDRRRRPGRARARRRVGEDARGPVLALGPLPRGPRRRLEAADLRASAEDLAVRPEERPDRAHQPRREPPR